MATRVYRTDISALRPVERRPDGTIRVDAHLSKCGVFQYMQPDGTIRRELRLPEDVFDQESLRSFEGVPVTNNHPPGMVSSKTARQYSVGAVLGSPVPDDDHMRGRLAVHDHQTVQDMEAGKTQVSNGYTCDTEETPGVHPLYGVYDAIQRNIRGNHVAIVDRARAGITASARMDGMMVPWDVGAAIAYARESCDASSGMAIASTTRTDESTADQGTPSASRQVDPDDEAARNAAGKNNAKKATKQQPGEMSDRGGDIVRGAKPNAGKAPESTTADPDADDDDDEDSMYDGDGELTEYGQRRVNAASFALPDKKKLPIHDSKAVRQSMRDFAKHQFDSPDEKHGAFNRITSKAKAFGMDTAGFENRHAGKLDQLDADPDKDSHMTPTEIKALQEKADKADKRKEKLVAAKAKIDSLETEKAQLQSQVQNLTKELETSKSTAGRADAQDDKKFQERVDAQVALLEAARATGAKVEAKMSPRAIKCAVIKHVDGDDVAADKHDAYVDGVYEGALKRAKTDAAATARGQATLDSTIVAVQAARSNPHLDADADEEASKAAMRAQSRNQAMSHEGRNGDTPAHTRAGRN